MEHVKEALTKEIVERATAGLEDAKQLHRQLTQAVARRAARRGQIDKEPAPTAERQVVARLGGETVRPIRPRKTGA
jgi:hypothetical protein